MRASSARRRRSVRWANRLGERRTSVLALCVRCSCLRRCRTQRRAIHCLKNHPSRGRARPPRSRHRPASRVLTVFPSAGAFGASHASRPITIQDPASPRRAKPVPCFRGIQFPSPGLNHARPWAGIRDVRLIARCRRSWRDVFGPREPWIPVGRGTRGGAPRAPRNGGGLKRDRIGGGTSG